MKNIKKKSKPKKIHKKIKIVKSNKKNKKSELHKKIKVKKIKLNKKRIKSLSEINNIEDIYHLTTILSLDELDKLMLHYKKNIKGLKKRNISKSLISIIKKYKTPLSFKVGLHEEVIKYFKEEYDKIYQIMSEKRKKGTDTFISELIIMSINPKIKIFDSTKEKKDYFIIKNKFNKLYKILEISKNKD